MWALIHCTPLYNNAASGRTGGDASPRPPLHHLEEEETLVASEETIRSPLPISRLNALGEKARGHGIEVKTSYRTVALAVVALGLRPAAPTTAVCATAFEGCSLPAARQT